MNLKSLMRRNRFKAPNKAKQDKPKWQLPALDWRANLRRLALVLLLGGALSALAHHLVVAALAWWASGSRSGLRSAVPIA